MDSYYYLVASLPTLLLEEEPPITTAEFLESCGRWLNPGEVRDMRGILEDAFSANENVSGEAPCVSRWREHETQIRNAVAKLRAPKTRTDAEPFMRPCRGISLFIDKAVAEAMSRPNPLERELALDQLRWKLAEDLALFEPFGLAAVAAYAVKLKLVERWSVLDKEKALAVVEDFLSKQLAEAEALP